MARDRKCILCETVHISRQEMEEHIRSMLHHRELEKLKGRDCGHECRVCKVKVASLTDYAGHISSPSHKQKVEAADHKQAGYDRDEDYFDQALVDLIDKRKEQIRKEKEAAAQLAKEEEEQKRQEAFQQRLQEAKEQYRREHGWQPPSRRYGGAGHHGNWYGGQRDNYGQGEWHHGNQGRSSTWHAQEPPNLHRWASEEFAGGRNQEWRGNRTWGQGSYPQNPQNRLPWLSSGGSSNGLYGRNNISQYAPRGPPQNFSGPPPRCPPLPTFLTQSFNQYQNGGNDQRGQQGAGCPNGEGQPMETDHNGCKSSKAFGSNPKLDKPCRWSPYPVTKGPEAGPCHDGGQNPSEKHPKVSKPQRPDREPEPSGSSRWSRPEHKPAQPNSSWQSVDDVRKHQARPTDRRDEPAVTPSPGQKVNKPSPQTERKISSVPDLSSAAKLGKASSQAQANPVRKLSGIKSPPCGAQKQSSSERQLLKTLKKARQLMLEKKGSPDDQDRTEATQEEQSRDQSHVGVNKENSCVQNAAKQTLSGSEKRAAPSSFSSRNLQSLQVSTSTAEAPEPETNWTGAEKQLGPAAAATDEAMQVGEAGHGSETDAANKSGEALAASGLSRLDLPPVLKRDLTKHISSKSKAIGHEPNLNIARRVRNLSESRRSDSDKDSGIKPTVRQLISSSGSRRNVNWEQVYQEVRKKQDKGKGMPRFGIEMVPCEQEYQSQEEDDIPLLEGFQWESLMDTSSQSTSRKRSLSESSVAPASSHSLFPPSSSKETSEKEELRTERQASAASSNHKEGPSEAWQQQLGQSRGQAQRQPEKLLSSTVRALQRSDSVPGDISSGAEQHDGQGTGKRRRAAVDLTSPESSCLEHDSKRRKVKSKKERLQIDQLLAVSLREEELSRSLQTVDTSLVQARAALEAAYVEVQRLMVVKQQMTGEMDSLRNKRIELLRGMQNAEEETPAVKLKEEKVDSVDVEASVTLPAAAATQSPSRAAECASPPSSSLPSFTPVVIKQEPQSPVDIGSEPHPVDDVSHCAHSTTSELPAAPASAPDPAFSFEPCRSDAGEPADCKESLRELIQMTEKGCQTGNKGPSFPADSKSSIKLLPPSRRGSGAADCADNLLFQAPAPPPPNLPASPSDLRGGKRVRKLKKRKALKKAQGAEQPETSDTEGDEEASSRPRWLRSRRRPSGGSQVSTSSLPTEEGEGNSRPPRQLVLAVKLEKVDLQMLKLKMERQREEPVASQDREESMEVTASLQQPKAQSLACNEVSSTSDMDLCRSSESDLPFAITQPKNSSDASSDHGEDDMPSEGVFEGHQEAVNAMQIHNGQLYTCSGDRTVKVFDLVSRKCVGVFEGHSSKVSCLLVSAAPSLHHRLYSGSSDQTIRCYSLKTREFEQQFSLSDRVLCLHSRWRTLYAGLANGTVVTFNLKTNKQTEVFECHGPRAVSCLASSQEGARRILLVGSYDNTISVRDAKNGLLLRLLEGHSKTVLCMKVVNDLVFSGSSDQCVHAHNIHTGELVQVYKGHSHGVTVVSVLGKVMVTACLDKRVRVYDLQSHEQLQVYAGHKDMVMCMAVHKNMIYSGCYDGSVQAVKLNLMQSYRCWWHGCSMAFGVADHLQQHLLSDHAGANAPVLKCRWKNCEEFFGSRSSSKQGMLLHMQKHAAEETEVEP